MDKLQRIVALYGNISIMAKKTPRLKGHLMEKRNEMIWALLEPNQGYTYTEIAAMYNNLNKSTVLRIAAKKPKNYRPKWVKVED